MENEKLGQEPAFSCEVPEDAKFKGTFQTGPYDYINTGMFKRFYAATKILQGFASDPNITGDTKIIVETAYTWADELLRQEDL